MPKAWAWYWQVFATLNIKTKTFEVLKTSKVKFEFKVKLISYFVFRTSYFQWKHINSNSTIVTLSKQFEPNLGRAAPYTIRFDNPLLHPISGYTSIISSTMFGYRDSTSSALPKPIVDCYLDDDGYGNLRIYKQVASSKVIIAKNTGSIDYATGLISLRNFIPEYLDDGQTTLKITAIPEKTDIFARRNQIIVIDDLGISVTGVPEKTIIDRNASDSAFTR